MASRPFRAWLTGDDEPSVTADAVILATGAQSLMLGVPGEDRLLSHGLSTCATCDGFFFRGQEIAVVGGGDSAIEEATFLTRFASQVTIVHRRDALRASKIMQERAFANDKIDFAWNTEVTEVLGDEHVTGLAVRDTLSGEARVLDVTGVFVAIGHVPNTTLVAGDVALEGNGYVKTVGHELVHVDRRALRRRRRAGPRLPPGGDRRGHRVRRRDRRRALAGGAGPLSPRR